jgi:hypothetical protein
LECLKLLYENTPRATFLSKDKVRGVGRRMKWCGATKCGYAMLGEEMKGSGERGNVGGRKKGAVFWSLIARNTGVSFIKYVV